MRIRRIGTFRGPDETIPLLPKIKIHTNISAKCIWYFHVYLLPSEEWIRTALGMTQCDREISSIYILRGPLILTPRWTRTTTLASSPATLIGWELGAEGNDDFLIPTPGSRRRLATGPRISGAYNGPTRFWRRNLETCRPKMEINLRPGTCFEISISIWRTGWFRIRCEDFRTSFIY